MNNDESSDSLGHMPLWWLLLPQITGYILGHELGHLLSSMGAAFVAMAWIALSFFFLKIEKKLSLTLWALSFFIGATMLSAAYFSCRQAPSLPNKPVALREAELTLKIMRVLSEQEGQRGLSAYAKVTGTTLHMNALMGQRIYLKTLPIHKPIDDVPVIKGSVITVKGVAEFIPTTTKKTDSFNYFLMNNGFSYKITRAKMVSLQSHGTLFHQWCYAMNQRLQGILQLGAKHDGERALANVETAMMLGKKDSLDSDQKAHYRASGTMHLFAISGLHVGVIVVTIMSLLKLLRIPPAPATIVGLSILFLYVQIIGATPSAVRALIMAILYYGAYLFKRKPSTLSALLGSALVVLILDPNQLFYVGFQLSYVVVSGILIYALPLIAYLNKKGSFINFIPSKNLGIFRHFYFSFLKPKALSLFCISFTAFLFGTPLTSSYFNILTPGAIFLNMLLLPLASFSIVSGLVTLIFGLLHIDSMAALLNHFSWGLLSLMDWILKQALELNYLFLDYTKNSITSAFIFLISLFTFLLTLHSLKKHQQWYFFLAPIGLFLFWLAIG